MRKYLAYGAIAALMGLAAPLEAHADGWHYRHWHHGWYPHGVVLAGPGYYPYYAPAPVLVAPPPFYAAPPVYAYPQPVYVAPRPTAGFFFRG